MTVDSNKISEMLNSTVFTPENIDMLNQIKIDYSGNFLNGKKSEQFDKIDISELKNEVEEKRKIEDRLLYEQNVRKSAAEAADRLNKSNHDKDDTHIFKASDGENLGKKSKDVLNSTINLTATGIGAYQTGKVMANNMSMIISNIITEATNIFIHESTAMLTEATLNILKPPSPIEITNIANAYFNKHKKSMGDVVKSIAEPAEITSQKNKLSMKNEKMDNFITRTKAIAGGISEQINTFNEMTTANINAIMAYATNGPDWLSNQINNMILNNLKLVQTYIDSAVKNVEESKHNFVVNTGTEAGKVMTEEYNKTIELQAKKQADKVKEQKNKAMIKAKAMARKAIFNVMALTGMSM